MPRDTDHAHLHPEFRQRAEQLIDRLAQDDLPFRLFEGFRSPQRQRELYAQGRTKPGAIVTRARPWQSYHQYGLGADFVLFIDGQWSWDDRGPRDAWWKRLHQYARAVGLEPLSFERPHVQLAGLDLDDLRSGRYPAGGDASWSDHLEAAIESWSGSPQAPPLPQAGTTRPPLRVQDDAPAHEPASSAPAAPVYRVIARRGLRLRAGPGTEHDVIGNLATGQRVHLLGSRGDWSLIDAEGDGLADGYCHRGFLVPA